jgi:hypothetical protein
MRAPVVRSTLLAFLMAGGAFAIASASTVTLQPSTLSFKQALSACSGSLGSITFTLGHARAASLPGVTEQVDTSSAGIDTITFTNANGKSASATANGHNRTVSAKNVQVKWKEQLACVSPD